MSAVQDAFNYFVNKGWTPVQAAGIVGGLQQESGLDPQSVGDSGSAYGIAQWHADRQAAFQLFTGKDIRNSTLDDQLAFVNHELLQPGNGGSALSQASNVNDAATIFAAQYERPASTNYSAYVANAQSVASTNQTSFTGAIMDAATNGSMIDPSTWLKIAGAAASATGNVASNAASGVSSAISSISPTAILTTIWQWIKEHLIMLGVGAAAVTIILASTWNLVEATPVGSAVKTAAKVAAVA